jgi:hypothetical protein
VRAAHEFEAQMMKELMKPMTSGSSLDGRRTMTRLGLGGALGEFASEALGRAERAGRIWDCNSIVKELSHSR